MDETIDVITYSGYRGEERPMAFFLYGEKIEVVEIIDMWIEEGLEDMARRRFFQVKGSDGYMHKIYNDERATEWFYKKV
ncbi:MAG: hypothetical protein QMC83_08430 [Thermodesulfovibrionales bacterium]|nr:hypothetical protein [Thermodesulfovibrionales bacterium]